MKAAVAMLLGLCACVVLATCEAEAGLPGTELASFCQAIIKVESDLSRDAVGGETEEPFVRGSRSYNIRAPNPFAFHALRGKRSLNMTG
ncbi:Hypp6444 [Branchiostoma lanceolatum]|uniref:Hypp6444 protein n=1 Tax=Branchiostoma lanceolatum TaxID=7740 RepID=A0A8J9YUE3_BRALA|nr:Hypp6444 [Branchiostoma lanceolatum]